jgi:catechol 2,3-dioxygenase-like lactoylglutathione lyase family enzyme
MAEVRYKPLHVGISVSNLEDGIAWFEDILGFTLREKSDFVPVGFRVAFLDNGGGFEVELFENKETKPASEERFHPDTDSKTQGTKHIAFEVDDLEKELAYFKTKGIEPVMGPKVCFGLYVAFIHGPDKVLIELIEWKR